MAPIYFVLMMIITGPDGEGGKPVMAGVLLNEHICRAAGEGVRRSFIAEAPEGWTISLGCEPQKKGTVGA